MQRGDRVGGRFEIVDRVASGGMGTVFRGRDVRSKRDVAVKIIAAAAPAEVERFAREAQILAGFAHPAVVGYVAHGPDYLVMEWVDGETLQQRLDRASLTAREAVHAVTQLAGALAALHAAGIVHRDIKPANLMITGSQLKLVDFGIARAATGARVTLTGTHIGTAGYMAPEQARGDRDITGGADVFALGCVLYECLAGVPAYSGESAIALRAKVLLHDPPRLRAIAPAVPDVLDALVTRLLTREPAARPTAREVEAQLAAAARDAAWPERAHRVQPLAASDAAHANASTSAGHAAATTVCTVLVALPSGDAAAADREPGTLVGLTHFTDGAVATCPDPDTAARLALALASELPGATVAIACGASPADAIDRGARLVEQLQIATASGDAATGAWIDDSAAGALGGEFAVEPHGDRVRLRGLA